VAVSLSVGAESWALRMDYEDPLKGLQQDLKVLGPVMRKVLEAVTPSLERWWDPKGILRDLFLGPFGADLAAGATAGGQEGSDRLAGQAQEVAGRVQYGSWMVLGLLCCPNEILNCGHRSLAAIKVRTTVGTPTLATHKVTPPKLATPILTTLPLTTLPLTTLPLTTLPLTTTTLSQGGMSPHQLTPCCLRPPFLSPQAVLRSSPSLRLHAAQGVWALPLVRQWVLPVAVEAKRGAALRMRRRMEDPASPGEGDMQRS